MEIVFNHLKKNFGDKTVVDIPEFMVNSNEILGLVGNNGAGKTTLFRLILDLIKADEGFIMLSSKENQQDFRSSDAVKEMNPAETEEWKQITGAYIDEGFLIDFLTPEEYFEFIGKANGINKETIYERLSVFDAFMAGEIMNQKKYIRNFSAGNKQKIGIISAFLNHPQLIILDEPFNFLDPTSQNILKHILEDYHQNHQATILISSHNLQHTIDVSTRIALLEHGCIVKDLQNKNKNAEKELEEYFDI